ncbi:hypothetical protein HGRIS_014669 [Hohenbuehelia grisea]|uniref:Uncharacterized protein n=1 Tax=Hohenbuehelia grisea TaxID=104357 RepID=A0ABR3JW57_9AGAR
MLPSRSLPPPVFTGKVLRSLVWAWTYNLSPATQRLGWYCFSLPSLRRSLWSPPKARVRGHALEGLRAKGLCLCWPFLGRVFRAASIADAFAISALVDVVFDCGITMQRAWNTTRRTTPTMPCYRRYHRSLLVIVNYNAEGQQYVWAGELVALEAMMNVLDHLKVAED